MRDKLRQAGGQKGRGSGGRNFCPPAEAKPRRPARLPRSELRSTTGVQSRTQKKSFLFLLPARRSPRLAEAVGEAQVGAGGEEKIGGARKLKIVKKTFLRGGEVSERRRGWLPYWGFCSKNVRTSIKKHRQFSLFLKS